MNSHRSESDGRRSRMWDWYRDLAGPFPELADWLEALAVTAGFGHGCATFWLRRVRAAGGWLVGGRRGVGQVAGICSQKQEARRGSAGRAWQGGGA